MHAHVGRHMRAQCSWVGRLRCWMQVAAAKWMDADAYLEQSKERMPEGSVYYTLNHLAIQAYDGLQVGMQGRMLPLGAKLAPGVSNMVYHTEPKL
eukprot:COSAG01_NODE_7589_length_3137_cov_1.470046_3_plen_95_part_00